jgi:hypothetical protein
MADFSQLPIEIINIIINYTDVVVYRNGKYLNRIQKNDKRYSIIKKRKLPIWFGPNRWMFYFRFYDNIDKKGLAFEHTYNPNNKIHYLSKREIIKYDNDSMAIKDQTNYIFDLQGECCKIINYTM